MFRLGAIFTRSTFKQLGRLLSPSSLSGLVAIGVGVFLTYGIIAAFKVHNYHIDIQLIHLQSTSSQPTLSLPGQIQPSTANNSLQNTWPLILFWGIIGLIAYFIVETITKLISNVKNFNKELNYVHAKRDLMIRTTTEYFLFRAAVATAWLFFINLFFKVIIPYSIKDAHTAAISVKIAQILGYASLSFILIAFGIHLHVVFMRLILRRTRIFSRHRFR